VLLGFRVGPRRPFYQQFVQLVLLYPVLDFVFLLTQGLVRVLVILHSF
jgi:hypothetical protein